VRLNPRPLKWQRPAMSWRAQKAAADRDAVSAMRLAERANVDAQLAEATAQGQHSLKAATEFDASLQALPKLAAANSQAVANAALAQRDQAAQEAARAQAELDALKATSTPRGAVLTLGDVLFDTGKSELKSGASRKLDQLAQFLAAHPERRVQVDGFTDSVGPDAYNEDLSRRRADAVKSALLSRGVDARLQRATFVLEAKKMPPGS
jgi:outer membrane protein OmpA-like peptidoglycan-associated protein